LAAVPPIEARGRLVGLVSPHAGLEYSGPVAAWGYSLLRDRGPLTAVLVGPAHQFGFDGVALPEARGFATPFGSAPVDEEVAAEIERHSSSIIRASRPHAKEHCLEMQLPFLQRLVPSVQIVPLIMGRQSVAEVRALGQALAAALRGRSNVLLVASSDLSHYEPAEVARRLDGLVIGDVERFDDEALLSRLQSTHGHACGGGAIVAVMQAARGLGAVRGEVLRYADSGDAGLRDKRRVVGYLSAALFAAS
jgi:hypothetical protein